MSWYFFAKVNIDVTRGHQSFFFEFRGDFRNPLSNVRTMVGSSYPRSQNKTEDSFQPYEQYCNRTVYVSLSARHLPPLSSPAVPLCWLSQRPSVDWLPPLGLSWVEACLLVFIRDVLCSRYWRFRIWTLTGAAGPALPERRTNRHPLPVSALLIYPDNTQIKVVRLTYLLDEREVREEGKEKATQNRRRKA